MNKLSNQPPKGTTDWFPEDYAKRKYIFDVYREICVRFGYEEYLTPIVESADIYRAKSGEDIGGKELMFFQDKGGRELAIRPEMTPSVTRMITRIYDQAPKPLRYFSIANFFRNEKPQRGRSREFWQLNYDIFGSNSIEADIEIGQIGLEIMLAFNPPKDSFTCFINNRKLIDFILNSVAKIDDEKKTEVVRILDKWKKLTLEEFSNRLTELGLDREQISNLIKFMSSQNENDLIKNLPELENEESYLDVKKVIDTLSSLGYGEWIKFQPSVIRGFDYYDGIVYEFFDNFPENNRSLFGGGRYNGLAGIFGTQSFPATGMAPGELPIVLFLESWNLFPADKMKDGRKKMYFPIIGEGLESDVKRIANIIRQKGDVILEEGLQVERISKALDYANKKKLDFVLIFGTDEKAKGVYIKKDMQSGVEEPFYI